LAVDYAEQPAGLTLYYADSIGHATVTIPMVTPEGDLLLVGGIAGDNYKPLSTVWLYRFAIVPQSADTVASGATILWFVLALGVLTVFACVLYLYRRRKCMAPEQPSDQTPAQPTIQLMERIAQLLERDQRYLTRMKVSDVAVELGVSVSEVTECISQQHGCTFAQLMAAYRVRYAQQLLVAQPDMKLATLIAQSGFTSETTFFRSFKEVVGTSPKEWIESHKASHESTAET
jgi:AraC-like DNA-binding protein